MGVWISTIALVLINGARVSGLSGRHWDHITEFEKKHMNQTTGIHLPERYHTQDISYHRDTFTQSKYVLCLLRCTLHYLFCNTNKMAAEQTTIILIILK